MRAIYDFVSAHTRYIGIDFGIGRYQPHTASEVLADQYGDCKDKDTLLEALLRAKGFSTSPALMGAGIAPVPEVPSPPMFNHVITTVNLPGGRIWLDSTPLAAPYRYLERGDSRPEGADRSRRRRGSTRNHAHKMRPTRSRQV